MALDAACTVCRFYKDSVCIFDFVSHLLNLLFFHVFHGVMYKGMKFFVPLQTEKLSV